MASTHIICRQFLEVEFDGSESGALALQNRTLALCQDDLRAALERVFDQFARAEEHWTIDRLEIDAGFVSADQLERLIEAIVGSLERQLRGLQASAAAGQPSAPNWNARSERGADRVGGEAGATKFRTEAQSLRDAFLYFLETGVLPWWFQLPSGKSLEVAISDYWLEEGESTGPALFAHVLSHQLRFSQVRKRLARQFSFGFVRKLLMSVSQDAAAAVEDFLTQIQSRKPDVQPTLEFFEAVWEAAFLLASGSTPVTPAGLAAAFMGTLPLDLQQRHLPLLRRIQTIWPTESADLSDPQSLMKPASPTRHVPLVEPSQAPGSRLDMEEGVFTQCAGIVLLHPFLPKFFEALGVAANDSLVHPARALRLLHYLATGQPFAPEYDLVVPKVLCNVPLDIPVSVHSEMSADEEAEANALLQAVIGHWTALGDTSVDNLRGSFLVRPGKLSQRDGEYLLQLEPKSYDVLLDQLPWGLGLVKLPWMQQTLWVEWRF